VTEKKPSQTTSDELELGEEPTVADVVNALRTTVEMFIVVGGNANRLCATLDLHRVVIGEDLERLLLSLGILRVGLEELEGMLAGLRSEKKEC
jgi:hypothetical protein